MNAEKSRTMCGMHKVVADVALFSEGKVLLIKYVDMTTYDNESG